MEVQLRADLEAAYQCIKVSSAAIGSGQSELLINELARAAIVYRRARHAWIRPAEQH